MEVEPTLYNDHRKSETKSDILTAEERKVYLAYILKKYPDIDQNTVAIVHEGEYVNISFQTHRKIVTKMGGTLIVDPETWNKAKLVEYHDTLPDPIE